MSVRPHDIACVNLTDDERPSLAWCGRATQFEFSFIDTTHAALNGKAKGRLMVCEQCRDAIIAALNNGYL